MGSPLGMELLGRAAKLGQKLAVNDAQLDTSHHLPPSCIPEIWVCGDRPV